jgi:hypothetical protein
MALQRSYGPFMDHYDRDCTACGWPSPAGAGPCLHCLTPQPIEPVPLDSLGGVALAEERLPSLRDSRSDER